MRPMLPLVWILSLGTSPANAATPCTAVPADAAPPPVLVCETAESYSFEITGSVRVYDKTFWRDRLREVVTGWYSERGATPPEEAVIEVWMAVPEADPAAAQPRMVVRGADGGTVFFLGHDPAEWQPSNRDVSVIDQGAYPEAYGHRAGQLLVKGQTGAKAEELAALLAEHGAETPVSTAPGWFSVNVTPLQETQIRAALKADTRYARLIDKVEVNAIMEWIATRGQVFAFSLSDQ